MADGKEYVSRPDELGNIHISEEVLAVIAAAAAMEVEEMCIRDRARRMPNWAEEMVAPVVGETNLFMQSCCMIRPATLMPTPVHRIASRRGRREIRKISSCSSSPDSSPDRFISITPRNSDQILSLIHI